VNSFPPKLEATASEALGRQVKVGNLSLSILTGTVTADDISIADDPAFGRAPFVTAKSLKVGVELMPLIFSKQLHVNGITLEQPQITMLKTADGKWNFSSLGGKCDQENRSPANSGDSTPTDLSVAKLSVNDGKLIVGKANSKPTACIRPGEHHRDRLLSRVAVFRSSSLRKLPAGGDADISREGGSD